jgi:uncharacterized OsmC-like protein
MDKASLRAKQKPLKEKYAADPDAARITMHSTAVIDRDDVSCQLDSFLGPMSCGLHPGTGGDGTQACSAEMLLQALAGCAGVTLKAVATALEIPLRSAEIHVEGDLDFRGTLGIEKSIGVGFQAIRIKFVIDSDQPEESITKLIELTERYCVVLQTLRHPVRVDSTS